MTGLLLVFTGWAVSITSQIGGTCVAHAISHCESIYGINNDPQYVASVLGIGFTGGYDINKLSYTWSGISIVQTGDKQRYINMFSQGPLLIGLEKGYKLGSSILSGRHLVCGVGYNDRGIVVANSNGPKWGIKGYAVIPRSDINKIIFQNIGSGTKPYLVYIARSGILTPSLITLTDKKEDSIKSGQMVKSPRSNKKNTKRNFLRPLD